jgi:hypothetical protein
MTQYYVGIKIVMAWPQEKDGKPGYSVKYEDGYTSWSPKEVFDKCYLPMGKTNDNKVTPQMVDLFTGKEYEATQLDAKTTLLKCDTATGFVQYETSSCVDPANFDMEIGSEICLERIKNTIWKCLGFVVQWGRFGLKRGV